MGLTNSERRERIVQLSQEIAKFKSDQEQALKWSVEFPEDEAKWLGNAATYNALIDDRAKDIERLSKELIPSKLK